MGELEDLVWNINGDVFTSVSAEIIERYVKKIFIPFPGDIWRSEEEAIISWRNSKNVQVVLYFGYNEFERVAAFIERYDVGGERWMYYSTKESRPINEFFSTRHDVTFPKNGVLRPSEAFEAARDFILNPYSLPSSVFWTSESDIIWPD